MNGLKVLCVAYRFVCYELAVILISLIDEQYLECDLRLLPLFA